MKSEDASCKDASRKATNGKDTSSEWMGCANRGKRDVQADVITDLQAQVDMLEGVLDRMDARGRVAPDPNSEDAQERADADWLAEMREAKADSGEADALARHEYQKALHLLQRFGFFHGEAGALIKQHLDHVTDDVNSDVFQGITPLISTVKVLFGQQAVAMTEGVLRLEAAGFATDFHAREPKDNDYEDIDDTAELSFELHPSFMVEAADFLKLCQAP